MKNLSSFLLLSFLLHSLCLLINVSFDVDYKKGKYTVTKVEFIKRKKTTEKKEKKKKEEKEEIPEGQIVDLPPDYDSKKPEEAEFLSETDHTTERETVSRHRTATRQSSHETTKPSKSNETVSKRGTDGQNEEKRNTRRSLPSVKRRDRLALKQDNNRNLQNDNGSFELRGKGNKFQLEDGKEKQEILKKGPRNINLFPDDGTLLRVAGAPFRDHIEDVEEGEGTFLNAHAFKYSSFFNRVKRGVVSTWRPFPELLKEDPVHAERKTVISVTLDEEGYILGTFIKHSSSVDFLDQEAINAIMRCRQFPNPPKGMIEDGRIRFDFGFHVGYNKFKGFF